MLLGKRVSLRKRLGKSFGWVHSMACPNIHNAQRREEGNGTGLPALNLLARLRKPSPLSPRRWSPGHKTRLGVKSRGRHERASQELEAPPQRGRRKPEALPPEGLGSKSSTRKDLLRPWTSQQASLPTRKPLAVLHVQLMSAERPAKSQSRTWDPYSIVPIYRPHLAVDVATDFRFEAHAEGTTSPWEMQKQRAMRQFSGRHTRGRTECRK